MIAQVGAWALFAVAFLVAAATIVATVMPEVARIRAVLRWQEHDRRAGLARRAGEVRP